MLIFVIILVSFVICWAIHDNTEALRKQNLPKKWYDMIDDD